MTVRTLLAAASLLTLAAAGAQAKTEIQWWHAMTGANLEVVEGLARDFTASQEDYEVLAVFKGTYPETLNAAIAAYRAGQPPHIVQVFDAGTGVMMGAGEAIMPVAEVMAMAGADFDPARYLPGIVNYYSTPDGQMLSFPLNSSSPILYYNKEAFRQAGLDENAPPATWPEVWEAARALKAAGWPCGLTSTWLTWIQVENFSAWNNQPFATLANGLGGIEPELQFNGPLNVQHFQALADLAAEGVFKYGGRTSEAKPLFLSGECAMMTESSGGLGDIVNSDIDFGTGPLPYYPEAEGAPQNTIPGGASLWVFSGFSEEEYRGIAAFFEYLSQTDVQVRLHQVSGYLPITLAAYEATQQSGFYEQNPGREQPVLQMVGKAPTENSRGVRLINLPQVRDIINEELEAMLAGQATAQQALDNAVARGNEAIRQAAADLQY
jgi:sn-glycerol 3-phosphate transport system substrate-binding protein